VRRGRIVPIHRLLAVLAALSAGAVVGAVPVAAATAAPAAPAVQVAPEDCRSDAGTDTSERDPSSGSADTDTDTSRPETDTGTFDSDAGDGEVRIVVEIQIDFAVKDDPAVVAGSSGRGADSGSGSGSASSDESGADSGSGTGSDDPDESGNASTSSTDAASSGRLCPEPAPEDCLSPNAQPAPGDTVCFSEDLTEPLEITAGGTEQAPVRYRGNGVEVPGIRVDADHVVLEGFVSRGAEGTGIEVTGDGIVVRDNEVTQVMWAGDDLDAIRFFGDGIQLLGNRVHDLEGSGDIGDSHVDCMQTFATSGPGSSDVVIRGNRCEQIRSQCLMAEGPHDEGGSGEGQSRNWLFEDNYCDSHAEAQSVALEDIQDVTITGNEMVGTGNKAFALGAGTTGTVVRDNEIGPGYGREVGFDDPSAAEGYEGPPVSEDESGAALVAAPLWSLAGVVAARHTTSHRVGRRRRGGAPTGPGTTSAAPRLLHH
jgi:hypothetical protein